jgi:hypothetical protein
MGKWKVWLVLALGVVGSLVVWALLGPNVWNTTTAPVGLAAPGLPTKERAMKTKRWSFEKRASSCLMNEGAMLRLGSSWSLIKRIMGSRVCSPRRASSRPQRPCRTLFSAQ